MLEFFVFVKMREKGSSGGFFAEPKRVDSKYSYWYNSDSKIVSVITHWVTGAVSMSEPVFTGFTVFTS